MGIPPTPVTITKEPTSPYMSSALASAIPQVYTYLNIPDMKNRIVPQFRGSFLSITIHVKDMAPSAMAFQNYH